MAIAAAGRLNATEIKPALAAIAIGKVACTRIGSVALAIIGTSCGANVGVI